MFTFIPLPHEEAVARIAGLPLVSREVMDGMLPELRAYAFTITGLDVGDQMAKARDLIAAVPKGELTWDKAKKEGLLKTWQEAMGRLDTPTPLGYSSAGIIEQCGIAATEFSPGDRVACVGQGFASHAEFVSIPVNLACRIPEGVSDDEASFGMLGIIALHGIRSAKLTFGSKVVVLGLGLLGLLTIQMLRAYGCEVIALDPAQDKTT